MPGTQIITPIHTDTVKRFTLLLDGNWIIQKVTGPLHKVLSSRSDQIVGMRFQDIINDTVLAPLKDLVPVLEKGQSLFNYRFLLDHSQYKTAIVTALVSNGLKGVADWIAISIRFEGEDFVGTPILDNIGDGVFIVNTHWRIIEFNKAAERITGWLKKEVIGKKCSDIFKTAICSNECVLAKAIEEKRPFTGRRVFVKTKSGHTLPISISASPFIDITGKVRGGVEVFRDITEEVEREIILDSIGDGVFTVDRHWRITSFNRAAEEITGMPVADALGKQCREVFQSSLCGEACAMAMSIRMGKRVANRRVIIKRANGESVPISISTAPLLDAEGNIIGGVETFRDLREIDHLRKRLTGRYTLGDIISKSPQMQKIFQIIPEIAMSDSNVLILGESGTGKELVARALHNFSKRKRGPFVAVNCGALPDTLLESELFGYKKGAFTDAKQDKEGRFAAAEKGTLFLDEIGDISPALQVKLLRVIQSKVYEPLGSNKPVKADVRIIAATNKDLHALVKEEKFREDLYYRLNVVKIVLPPLRERLVDVPLLVDHFIQKFNVEKGKDVSGISEEALNLLMKYDYPGNIRELENIIEYAFILCHGGIIMPEHLPEPFSNKDELQQTPEILPFTSPMSLKDIERIAIVNALRRNKGKKMATCRELGISKDTLRRKINQYKISEEEIMVPV